MIARGHGMEFSHSLDTVAFRMRRASEQVRKVAPVALTEVGVYCLAEAHRDYRAKSKQQTDKAGNRWPYITRSAIISRFHRRPNSPYMKQTSEIIRLRVEERTVLEDLRRRLPRDFGKDRSHQRAAIVSEWYKTPQGKKAKALRKRINGRRDTRKRMVDRDHSKAAIGVDTGRLVNSLDFKKSTPDMLLEQRGISVSIGTVVQYAGFFDAKRAIIASNFMTPARRTRCERIIQSHVDRAIRESLGDAGTTES